MRDLGFSGVKSVSPQEGFFFPFPIAITNFCRNKAVLKKGYFKFFSWIFLWCSYITPILFTIVLTWLSNSQKACSVCGRPAVAKTRLFRRKSSNASCSLNASSVSRSSSRIGSSFCYTSKWSILKHKCFCIERALSHCEQCGQIWHFRTPPWKEKVFSFHTF